MLNLQNSPTPSVPSHALAEKADEIRNLSSFLSVALPAIFESDIVLRDTETSGLQTCLELLRDKADSLSKSLWGVRHE